MKRGRKVKEKDCNEGERKVIKRKERRKGR